MIDSINNKVKTHLGTSVSWGEVYKNPDKFRIQSGKDEYSKILNTSFNGVKEVFQYTLDNGEKLDVTPNHIFLTRSQGIIVEKTIGEICEQKLPLLEIESFSEVEQVNGNILEYPEDLKENEGLKLFFSNGRNYGITNQGRLWAFNHTVNTTRNGKHHASIVLEARWLNSHLSEDDCEVINLGRPSVGFKIHRLVAEHFCYNPKPDEYFEVNHLDFNRRNNYSSNLEWTSRTLNNKYSYARSKEGKTSVFRGVFLNKRDNKTWKAQIAIPGERRNISKQGFTTEIAAAEYYDKIVLEKKWHLSPHYKALNFSEAEPSSSIHSDSTAFSRFKHSKEIQILSVKSLGFHEVGDIQIDNKDSKYNVSTVGTCNCRIDAVARDKGLVDLISYFGSSNITIAIEGVSQRIRDYLQKSLLEDEMYVGFWNIINSNFGGIKVYYIFTGMETQEDLDEFAVFMSKLDEMRKKANKPNMDIRLSFTPLLPTVGSPVAYSECVLERAMKSDTSLIYKIQQIAARVGFSSRISTSIPGSVFATILDHSERRLASLYSYASISGIANYPKFGLTFFEQGEEITKKKHDSLSAKERIKVVSKKGSSSTLTLSKDAKLRVKLIPKE